MKTKTTYIAHDGAEFENQLSCLIRDAAVDLAREIKDTPGQTYVEEADLVDLIELLNAKFNFLKVTQ